MGRLERLRKLARLPRLKRFSLRSLLLCVLLIGSGFGLWYRWGPWEPVFRFEMGKEDVFTARFWPSYDPESDTFWCITDAGDLLLWDGSNGAILLRKRVGSCTTYNGRKLDKEKYLYLANQTQSLVDVFDLKSRTFVTEFSLPQGLTSPKVIQSDDARWLACGMDGTLVQVRSTSDWTVKCEIGKKQGKYYVSSFSSNSIRLQIVTPDQTQYWDLEHGTKLLEGSSCDVASPSFESYLEFREKQPPVIRSIPDDQPPRNINVRDIDLINGWKWASEDVVLGFKSQKSDALVIDASTGEIASEIKTVLGEIQTLALPDGNALAMVIDPAGEAQALDLPSGQVKWHLDAQGERIVRVECTIENSIAYALTEGGDVFLWDLNDGQLIAGPLENGYGSRTYVSECADYWWIDADVYASPGRSDVWRKDNGRLVASLQWGRTGVAENIVKKVGGLFAVDCDRKNEPWLLRLSRPAFWYGFLWLPEFYLTLALAVALGWSLWRDRKL